MYGTGTYSTMPNTGTYSTMYGTGTYSKINHTGTYSTMYKLRELYFNTICFLKINKLKGAVHTYTVCTAVYLIRNVQ